MDPDDVEPFAKPQDGEIIVNKDTFARSSTLQISLQSSAKTVSTQSSSPGSSRLSVFNIPSLVVSTLASESQSRAMRAAIEVAPDTTLR